MRGLQDKVIVVCAGGTGATDGTSNGASIGGATARRLAQEGARVVVGDLSEPAAQRTVDLIEGDGGKAVAHRFDASDEASIAALMQRAIEEFGGIDGIHANAMDMSAQTLGVDGQSDLLTLPLDVWQRTIDVGLTGFLLCARYAIPPMLERGGGGIVTTVSGAVYVGEPIRLAYQTVKTGMPGLAVPALVVSQSRGLASRPVIRPQATLRETFIHLILSRRKLRKAAMCLISGC